MGQQFELRPIGRVVSSLKDGNAAPKQPDEGAPEAWLEFAPEFGEGLRGLKPGDQAVLITWLHEARRDVLAIHPRGDASRAPQGVFSPERRTGPILSDCMT
jgi:tRNA (Thr-GGU) A37 N-methylase